MQISVMKLDNFGDLPLPSHQTSGASGLDLHAAILNEIVLKPMEIAMVPTGLAFELPMGSEAQIRPRSGLSKKGILVYFGTVDNDFRGEVSITVQNLSGKDFVIKRSDRLAQLVVSQYTHIELNVVDDIQQTSRGTQGWGSTGGFDGC
jgi:dUTP pyrophosphatase